MEKNPELTFEEVLQKNTDKIYRICRVYATDPVEPKDLFQEVVFQVWKSFSGFRNEASIDTWIYRISLNVCMRAKLKLDKRNEKIIRTDAIQYLPAENADDETEQEKYRLLRACIEQLKEPDATIIILYLEELSHQQIGAVTGLSENHVAVKMKRIKSKLFDCINPKLS